MDVLWVAFFCGFGCLVGMAKRDGGNGVPDPEPSRSPQGFSGNQLEDIGMGYVFPLMFLSFLLFMGASLQIPSRSGIVPVYSQQPADGSSEDSASNVYDFIAVSRATLAYAEANAPSGGSYTAQQLAPYMGGVSFPPNWQAQDQGGDLVVWTDSATSNDMGMVSDETTNDCAYGYVQNGEILSECGGIGIGAAPAGAANGDLAWMVQYPSNENN